MIAALAHPEPNDLLRLIHELREPLGSFAIRLSLLETMNLTKDARKQLDAMRASIERMAKAVTDIASAFGLDAADDDSGPLTTPSPARRPSRAER